jgi:mannobiose 2-epimerase
MELRVRLERLAHGMSQELEHNILPFWLRLEDRDHGGHYGAMDLSGRIEPRSPKAAVFVSRLLWTLSQVGSAKGDQACLAQASRTKRFLLDHVRDRQHGGFFWSVSHEGSPLEADKHVYAQAFSIYALSAHARATADAESLAAAQELFALIEERSRQPGGGYGEAFDREWRPIENRRLAPHGGVGTLTSNTHLHLIEAYTALAEAWADARPFTALRKLVVLFLESFLAAGGTHSHQTLSPRLEPYPGPASSGHDIEISWLIEAAGDVLADGELSGRLRAASAGLAAFAAQNGQARDGGWFTAGLNGSPVGVYREAWAQAEAVVGLVNAATRGNLPEMMDRAEATWTFIVRLMIDRAGGDWFEAVNKLGQPRPNGPKVGPWKDPYHQARACLEIARRSRLLQSN